MSEKRCYTVKELQAILGVSRPSVYELLKRDVFRSFIVGASILSQKAVLMNGSTETLRQKKARKSWTSDFETCIIKVI